MMQKMSATSLNLNAAVETIDVSHRVTETQRIRDFMKSCDHLTTLQFHHAGEIYDGEMYRQLVKLRASASLRDDMNTGALLN